jgi:hypothetical protein
MLISELIRDVLPRAARPGPDQPNGITFWVAVNSIQSLIYKHLLDRKSDLLATGELFLVIPPYDYMSPLPTGFISMAEKPRASSAPDWLSSTAWMAGTVTSYTPATKTLVMNVLTSNGTGTLSSWYLAVGIRPGYPITTLDTSGTSVSAGIGPKTFVTATSLDLVPGQNIIISNIEIPSDSIPMSRLDPEYLNDDDHEDYLWWEEYKLYGTTFETASARPRKFKVVGTNFYVRPKVITPVIISGKYNAQPAAFVEGVFTVSTPWGGLFDEIFREGTVDILQRGLTKPDADQLFMLYFNREFGMLINARARIIPETGRTRRGNFM